MSEYDNYQTKLESKREKDRIYQQRRRINESPEEREIRILKARKVRSERTNTQKNIDYIKSKKRKIERKINETPEEKRSMLDRVNYMRNKKLKEETVDQREKRLKAKRNSQAKARKNEIKTGLFFDNNNDEKIISKSRRDYKHYLDNKTVE